MSEYKIDEQEWKSWPKAIMMRRDWTTNGHDHRKEVRRYVPDDESETLRRDRDKLTSDNAKLREQMKRLITLLRNDYDIDASWDGLRKLWSIELTEGGCLMRDRACKAEDENAKLRKLVCMMFSVAGVAEYANEAEWQTITRYLRELGIEVES